MYSFKDNACPAHSTCINKCVGHECMCDAGYTMENGKCEPICDENQCQNANACPDYSTCHNKCDGFECKCFEGYSMKVYFVSDFNPDTSVASKVADEVVFRHF